METLEQTDWGVHLYGAKLHINKGPLYYRDLPFIIDVETDEKDNFVGFAVTQTGQTINYFTRLDYFESLMQVDPHPRLVGHNLKGDMKWLINWGVKLKSSQLHYDTILASYVQNTTKDSHGLKDLAKEILGMEWPTYKDMVGSGRTKQTLDKQDVSKVANYCGMDCLATYRLYEYFKAKLTVSEANYLEDIELPTARALLDMELRGVQVDVPYLKELDDRFGVQLKVIKDQVEAQWFIYEIADFNINSNRQIAWLLEQQGATLPKTQKGNLKVDKATLEQWKHLPAVPLLLEYSKIEKLKSTYTESLLEKQKDGRIFCQFNQISKDAKGNSYGISTGRLSSSNPNLQNIPTRTEEGSLLRKAFTAGDDKIFIDADFSQIEPRLVAHFTKDRTFVDAFTQGRDIYADLVKDTGRDRQDGKTFMLALLYGAQPKKLASVFKCTEKEAEKIVARILSKLPGVVAWINRVKYEAHQRKGVRTLFGRWIPLPDINSHNRWERMHWERVAVNSVIQGSAAEIMKKSLIALNEAGYSTVLTVHDSFLTEVHNRLDNFKQDVSTIKVILESITNIDVPLKVSIGVGNSWGKCKENEVK